MVEMVKCSDDSRRYESRAMVVWAFLTYVRVTYRWELFGQSAELPNYRIRTRSQLPRATY